MKVIKLELSEGENYCKKENSFRAKILTFLSI